jgi:hypothetical protein
MFLDLGIAIITSVIANEYFAVPLVPLIYFALFFSMLPDLDFIIYKIFKIHKDKGYKHRDLFHAPLLYLPIGFIIIFFINETLAFIFLAISFLHFLHDSIAYGRGVKWLYPFSNNSYAFIYEYSRVVKKGLWQWVFIFNEKNLDEWDEEHGDEDWIKNIYYSLHPIAIIEFGVFFIALLCLIISIQK